MTALWAVRAASGFFRRKSRILLPLPGSVDAVYLSTASIFSSFFVLIDMPTPARTTEPDDIQKELWAIYEEGARGVILSRSLMSMRIHNLRAAGETIQAIRKNSVI